MTVEISQLTNEEFRVMRTAFEIFDKNNNDVIDEHEFGNLIRAIGFNPSNREIEETLRKFDKNGDGVIDFQEFISMAKHFEGCSKDDMEQTLRKAFRYETNRLILIAKVSTSCQVTELCELR